jgi:hypothetical protein
VSRSSPIRAGCDDARNLGAQADAANVAIMEDGGETYLAMIRGVAEKLTKIGKKNV